jgi:hypothetical protein
MASPLLSVLSPSQASALGRDHLVNSLARVSHLAKQVCATRIHSCSRQCGRGLCPWPVSLGLCPDSCGSPQARIYDRLTATIRDSGVAIRYLELYVLTIDCGWEMVHITHAAPSGAQQPRGMRAACSATLVAESLLVSSTADTQRTVGIGSAIVASTSVLITAASTSLKSSRHCLPAHPLSR